MTLHIIYNPPRMCPCCGGENIAHTLGDPKNRILDLVQCYGCGLEISGSYIPFSAVKMWNVRAHEI